MRVESFREIDSSKDRRRAQLGFVKPTRNRLRKIENLIKSRASRAETGLAGRENEVSSKKKSRRDCMMRSKSFEDGRKQESQEAFPS